jgi:acyl-CoA oxidase
VVDTPDDHARKEYIGNAADHGRMAAVFAQLEVAGQRHGMHVLLVPLRDQHGKLCEGIRIEDDGRYTSPIESANKRFFTTLGALVQGRVCISGASISAAKSALTIAVRYGLRRRQFGPPGKQEVPILDYRTHQRRLMPLLAKSYALHFAQDELRRKFHELMSAGDPPERDRRDLESFAAAMKATASWHATHTIQTCRECCGGAGYMAINRFAALKADTDIFTTFEGDNTVLMMLAAKGLLTDYKDQFGDLDPIEMVTFVAGQAVETVVERLFARKIVQVIGDAIPTGDGDSNLLERESQLDLFRWREGHITASVAQRALHNIEADRGFLQEHGRLAGPRCKAITREVNRVCNEVRQQAERFVDAFGIPDPVLAAPIGQSSATPA